RVYLLPRAGRWTYRRVVRSKAGRGAAVSVLTVPVEYLDSVQPGRVAAVAGFGFTERQARFLVTVMVHSGVFLERQYCSFAGISHGQKSHDFVAKLVDRRFATAITPG